MAKLSNRAKRHKAWLDKQSGESLTFASKLKLGGKAFESFMLHIDGGGELIDYPGGLEFIVAEEDRVLANKISAAEKELIREQRGNLSKGLLDAEPEAKEPKSIWKPDASTKKYVPSGDELVLRPDGTVINVRNTPEPEPRISPDANPNSGRSVITELTPLQDMTEAQKASFQNTTTSSLKANTGGIIHGMSELTAKNLVEAKNRLKVRAKVLTPTSVLSSQDVKDLALLKAYKDPMYSQVRHSFDPIYTEWSNLLGDLSREVMAIADLKFPKGSDEWKNFVDSNTWERGHLIPKGAQPHMRSINSNISGENALRNNLSKASYTLAEFVNNMERSVNPDLPRKLPREMEELGSLIKQLRSEGYDVSGLEDVRERLKPYPTHEPVLGKNSLAAKAKIFNNTGDFRQYKDLVGDPDSFVSSKEDYEKLRRLFITMMEGNPEWDFTGYRKVRNLPTEFIQGFDIGDGNGQLNIEQVREGNSEFAKTNLDTRDKVAKFLKQAGKAGIPLTALLAASGATYAADDSWSEDDYIDHILMNLEKYDKSVVQPGRDALMSLADKVGAGDLLRGLDATVQQRFSTIPDGMTKTGAEFIYGAAKDIPAEAIGLLSAAVKTPVAPAENMSWLERQQQNAWNNQDPMLNMVPVFQPANPVQKFGGVVQPMYGDPMLYE